MKGISCHNQGLVTEYKAAKLYTELGFTVCWPLYSQSPYDFIVENGGIFKRVQVKTPTWSKSGTHKYLQCRLGKDLRVEGVTSGTGCKYTDSCDEVIFIEKDTDEAWIFPTSVLRDTSNVCLKTSNPRPNVTKKSYCPDDYKI